MQEDGWLNNVINIVRELQKKSVASTAPWMWISEKSVDSKCTTHLCKDAKAFTSMIKLGQGMLNMASNASS